MCRKLIFLISFVALLGLVSNASATEWTGPGTSWYDAGNWSEGVPGPATDTDIRPPPAQGPIVVDTGEVWDVNCGRIHGPVWEDSSNMQMEIQSGTVIVNGTWRYIEGGSGIGTVTISGGDVTIRGRFMFSDKPGDYGILNITGGKVWVQDPLLIGDDGSGVINISGETTDVNVGALSLSCKEEGETATLNMDGGMVIVRGTFGAPSEGGGDDYACDVNLHGGTIICNEFTHSDNPYSMDIDSGALLMIKGAHIVEIIEDISLGYITGNNDTVEPSVMYKDGWTWVGFGLVQETAWNPSPTNGSGGICPEGLDLTWTAGENAEQHEVFFGASWDDVNSMTDPCATKDLGDANYAPGPLEYGKTYYWRVDEINLPPDPCTWRGDIWSFNTHSGKAGNPSPADGQRGAHPDSILTWTPPCILTGQTLYFGTGLPERIVLFDDGFEAGVDPNWTPGGWVQHDASGDANFAHSGTYSAKAVGAGVKTLTSDDIDAGDYANAIEVSLWVRTTESMAADELQLKYYNGSTYNAVNDFNVAELDPNGRWVRFTDTISDSQYLISSFRIQLVANITSGTVYVDDVTVTNTWPVDPNWWEVDLGANDNNYAPTLGQFTHYYWRVDTVTASGLIQGHYWDFATGFGGLIMYYKFNGNQGSNLPSPITDSTGNVTFTKYTGTGGSLKYGESNPVIVASTASADFDPCVGLKQVMGAGKDPLLLDGWQYTIEFWVKPENLDESLDIDEDDPEAEWLSDEFDLWLIGKFDSWKIAIKDPGGDDDEANTFHWDLGNSEREGTAVEGQWTHLAVVYDQTSEDDDNQFLYVDGELVSSQDADANPSDSDYPVTIGYAWKDDVNVGRYFDGLIDEVRIYDIALTPCEFLIYPGPEWASCPSPYDGEGEVDPCTVKLMWTPGEGMTSQDLYFSSDYDDVSGAGATAVETTYGPNSWMPPTIPGSGTVYYWRVDTYDNGSPPYEGAVWRFTTIYTIDDPNLFLWYKFDETSGDDVTDASGYGHHGDVDDLQADTWDPCDGKFYPGCIHFHEEERIDVEDDVLDHIGTEISISVWWKEAWRTGDESWFCGFGDDDIHMAVRAPDSLREGIQWHAGDDTNDILTWETDPKAWMDKWHHLVFTKNEAEGTMKIYFDAVVVASSDDANSGTLAEAATRARSGDGFRIGAQWDSGDDFVGKADDFRVYDYELSQDQINELFRGGDLCIAWGQSPYDGQQDAHPASDLVWEPGDWASSHEVYFGTNKQDVEDANNSWDVGTTVYKGKQGPNTYEPGPLDLDTTYFWRIDEVNDTNDKLSCRGDIWKFKVADYIVIDDFEDYESSADLWGSWIDGGLNSTGAFIALQSTSPINTGDKSMQYLYYISDFGCGSYYAQIQTKNLDPNNWDVFDGRILSLWFHGKTGNAATYLEQMYVGLEDDANYAEARYPLEDMDDIGDEEWYEWQIFLSDFTNVNMAKLETLFIGFGTRGSSTPGGTGTVHFDDIRVYPPYCVPEEGPKADLSGNCIVDFADIEIMADEWLLSDVNLKPVEPPNDANLVGRWEFDEGDGNVAGDSSGYDHNGVIQTIDVNVWWVAGVNDGNALEFDGGWVTVADDGNTPELRPKRKVSVMAWINRAHSVDDEEKVVVKGRNDWETYALEVSDENLARFFVRDANNVDNQYSIDSPDELPVNSWVHVAGTYDGNELTVYVNGQVAANSVHPLWEKLAADANDGFAIAGRWGDSGGRFTGTIDDVRVYNYALSEEEIGYIATDTTGILALESIADLYKEPRGEGAVNLKDFAELAKDWLKKQLWPP